MQSTQDVCKFLPCSLICLWVKYQFNMSLWKCTRQCHFPFVCKYNITCMFQMHKTLLEKYIIMNILFVMQYNS